jgi:hypothetical protein
MLRGRETLWVLKKYKAAVQFFVDGRGEKDHLCRAPYLAVPLVLPSKVEAPLGLAGVRASQVCAARIAGRIGDQDQARLPMLWAHVRTPRI